MHLPDKYYERIPKFYFFVGALLIVSSISKGLDDYTAFLHLFFGMMSVLYAVSVHNARKKHRNDLPADDYQQVDSEPEAEAKSVEEPEAKPVASPASEPEIHNLS